MKPSVLISTAVCGLLALPAVAAAQDQPWLKDRRYTEGIGYRVGDFEIHPGAALEFGYDSNYLHTTSADLAGASVPGSLRLRFTPSLSLSTLSSQRRATAPGIAPPSVEFRAGLSATYNEFIPVPSGTGIDRNRNIGVSADAALNILPGRPWSGSVSAAYSRLLTPTEQSVPSSFSSANSFNRDLVRVGGELVWTPGSGLFEWRLGYQFSGTFFESLSELTNLQNQVETRGRWRFLPRTSLVYDAKFGFITYPSPGNTGKTSSHPMRALLGVNGLVTNSFSVLAMVGWGASFYTPKPQEDFDSVIGQLELKWYVTPTTSAEPSAASGMLSSIAVGFTRDFYDSYIGTYYERDRGYASLSYFYGGRFLVVLDGGAGPIVYPAITASPAFQASPPFTDIRIDASLFGEWRFKDAFGLNATLRYNQNINHTPIVVTGPTGGPNDLSFQEFEAYLGVRWMM